MKKVRLLVAWGQYPKGREFTAMPAAQAQMLVLRGFAEYVPEVIRAPVREAMRAGRDYVRKAATR